MRKVILLVGVLVLAPGCDLDDGDGGGEAGGTATTTPAQRGDTTAGAAYARCTNEQGGYSVAYPEDWQANEGGVAPACSFFDPGPLELEEGTEPTGVAISVSREPVPLDRIAGDSPSVRDVQRTDVSVAGTDAVRMRFTYTGQGLYPEGTEGYQYLVPADGETIVLTTTSVGAEDFERARSVLDVMAESLELTG